ncbi:MAG: hypothetical protein AB7I04_10640 [Pseudomonadales bacterium]
MTPTPDCPTEADFLRHWRTTADGVVDEVELALSGGALADRFAWVFMSGYQAAIRRCFPEFVPAGWTCLAVAEPKDGPACTLVGDGPSSRLNGQKSWIAGSDSVEHLVVSVGADAERRFVSVAADAPGVTLTNPRTPTFLRELSQGAARFEAVEVPDDRILSDPVRAQWFRGAEPLYVLLALNACLKRQADALGEAQVSRLADTAIAVGGALPAQLGDKTRIVPGLDSLRSATTAVIESASRLRRRFPPSLAESWEADALLFGMFGVSGSRP